MQLWALLTSFRIGGSRKKAASGWAALALMAALCLFISGSYSFPLGEQLAAAGCLELLLMMMSVMAVIMGLVFTVFAAQGVVFGGRPTTSSVGPWRTSRPSLMMAMVSHSFSATSSTWVEKNTAPPSRHSSRRYPLSRWAAAGSRPTKGSSKIRSLGLRMRAEIIASFCFMPWE